MTESVSLSHLPDQSAADDTSLIQAPRRWRQDGWTAQVIKNEDDEGWAVAMYKDGEAEPALVGPWTMGRDKKNPKPLDGAAFRTLVKTASEVLRRHEQHWQATLHKRIDVATAGGTITVLLDIVPDEDDPYASLSARDAGDELLAEVRVTPGFKLNATTAAAWIADDFNPPR